VAAWTTEPLLNSEEGKISGSAAFNETVIAFPKRISSPSKIGFFVLGSIFFIAINYPSTASKPGVALAVLTATT
jgi:hypothetical protein